MTRRTAIRRVAILVVAAGAVTAAVLYRSGRLGGGDAAGDELVLYGNVDVRQVELGFRVPGRLAVMRLEEGQEVKAGDALAELDATTFAEDVRAAEAQVATQQAALQKLIAGPRPAEIARARAAVDEASTAAERARLELGRSKQLLDAAAIARASFDDATAASRSADARLASSRETLHLVQEGSRTEDIAGARAALAVATSRLAAAQTALADSKLLSPSDGVVTTRVKEPGAIVSPADVVYVVTLTRPLWIRAYVGEARLGALRPGMPVTIRSDTPGLPAAHGHVGFISPTAEFTPKSVETAELRTSLVYRVRIVVDDDVRGLHQGMPVTVALGGA